MQLKFQLGKLPNNSKAERTNKHEASDFTTNHAEADRAGRVGWRTGPEPGRFLSVLARSAGWPLASWRGRGREHGDAGRRESFGGGRKCGRCGGGSDAGGVRGGAGSIGNWWLW